MRRLSGQYRTERYTNQHPDRIRLNGIDCHKKSHAYGTRAKHATSELVYGKEVTLQTRGLAKYGRTIADVLLPGDQSQAGTRQIIHSHRQNYSLPRPSLDRLQCAIFAASTSTCSICGGSASNSGALAISAAAIWPARCALRPASSAKASKMPNVAGPNRSANQIGVVAS